MKSNLNAYLIQYLRKHELKKNKTNLAKYLGSVFNLLINSNPHSQIKINIYGACWGKFGPATDIFVDTVFSGISSTANLQIYLINSYLRYNPIYIWRGIRSLNNMANHKNNIHRRNIKYIDHAKMVELYIDGELFFFMIGSSNFSHTTYLTAASDEADISFIKKGNQSYDLITSITNSSDNPNSQMVNLWSANTGNIDAPDNYEYPEHSNDLETFGSFNFLMTFPLIYDDDKIPITERFRAQSIPIRPFTLDDYFSF